MPVCSPDQSASCFVTITPEWAERMQEMCDDGTLTDACTWAVTGFTSQGGVTFEIYWLKVQEYIASLEAMVTYYKDTITALQNVPVTEGKD